MSAKWIIRTPAPRTAKCRGCGHQRNRLAVHAVDGATRCTFCLGHNEARLNRLAIAHASALADLRAAVDHGSNDDVCRTAFALGYRVRLAAGGRMEAYS